MKDILQPYGDLWGFLENNENSEMADAVAGFLAEVFEKADDTRDRAVAAAALASSGLKSSQWLLGNRPHLTLEMITLFHSLGPLGAGRGRTAVAVALLGGALNCRHMLQEVEDKKEKVKLACYVASKLCNDQAYLLIFG